MMIDEKQWIAADAAKNPDKKPPVRARVGNGTKPPITSTPVVETIPAAKKAVASKKTKPAPQNATAKAAPGEVVEVEKKDNFKKSGKSGKSSADNEISEKSYDKEMRRLHVELVKLQLWVQQKGLKVIVVFEGRDGAGKGGTIKALTERVSPRVFRVVALPAPTDREKSQMYIQRYMKHFPAAGEIVIFDRSWYNRAGVERVMGFCSPEESAKFLNGVPLVERGMVDSGIILLKYWLEVSPEEQERRLEDRIDDGRKIWKLTPMDLKSFDRWDDYTRARDDMFKATDTSWAPWYVARSESKKKVRLNIIKHLLEHIPYKEVHIPKVKLPKRKIGRYKSIDYPFRMVTEKF